MSRNIARIANMAVTLALFTGGTGVLAGCGSDRAGDRREEVRSSEPTPAPEATARARRVADAWDGSRAAEVWGTGYHPMGEEVQLPESAFHTEADQRAYATGNFVLRSELPASSPDHGRVTWERGGSLTLPLMTARAAYESVDRGGGDGPRLTVTGAKLGEMTLATSRGPAIVPAWLFTLEGYDTPLRRAALGPSKLPEPPIKPVGETPTDELAPLGRLVEVAGDGRSVTVMANHGSCDDGPAVDVLETGGSVVLSAWVVDPEKGPCTSELRSEKVTVKLDRPMGGRVLLDAFTGRPVANGERDGGSPG
ncbi:hypothetical protein [Streptomyces xinghaiensis]|uniref:hypothetical protein n=1 Tax=Streptomyces xinghaiensis TaxID=1038928 RepID=UPI002E14F4FA|nr:hypothetical protein OG463_27220 [Streptomyces xinghaiensis]